MSVFASQPSFVASPSYSRTKIQPPPYKAKEAKASIPTPAPVSTPNFFNPIETIKRVFTNSSAATSTASIALSTAKPITSSTTSVSSPSISIDEDSPTDREQPSPSIPPPTYSPIKAAPKPRNSPPAYTANPEPRETRPGTGINPRSDTFITREQVIPSQSQGLAFNYEDEEWEILREREERRRFDELEASQREDQGCCAWWWSVGASPLPWAAYYVF